MIMVFILFLFESTVEVKKLMKRICFIIMSIERNGFSGPVLKGESDRNIHLYQILQSFLNNQRFDENLILLASNSTTLLRNKTLKHINN